MIASALHTFANGVMIGIGIGFFIGGTIGMILMACLAAKKNNEEDDENGRE